MNNIEVAVLDCHDDPTGMMVNLAKLTQRGHKINSMDDLLHMFYNSPNPSSETARRIAALPHGTIKRFCPITVAIVGASRRFLAQARTHQVGMNYVSASLQYSDYSGSARFVVPYEIIKKDNDYALFNDGPGKMFSGMYLESCKASMGTYESLAKEVGNDAAGYAAPQGLRNILIMQGNHESWANFIRTRACNRNTTETQYVTMLIWEQLLGTPGGRDMFNMIGPDCMYGSCREGRMCCGKSLSESVGMAKVTGTDIPRRIIEDKWPLL